MPDAGSPKEHEPAQLTSGLPAESLDRLSIIARTLLGDAALSASVLPLPAIQLLAEHIVCADTQSPGAPAIMVDLGDARAFVVIPLRDAAAGPVEDGRETTELALCVTSATPRPWSEIDISALYTVADTADTELRLRTELARHERITDELRKYPLHDPVTELGNRELFLDRVGQALMRYARAPQRQLAVMSLSLKQSEKIENSFGYDAVDEVLRELGRRLKVAVRNVDSAARLSGDEFGVLLESLRDNSDAARVASRIHDALRVPIATSWGDMMVSASIGIVLSEKGLDSPPRLIQLAGLARERAKETGAPFEIFDPQMQKRALHRLHSEMELRRAVEQEEFELHYQPIVDLGSGRIAKVEALVRWRHPKRGITAAAEFIPLAEETGLIVPMGWMVLSQGCRQLQTWRAQAPSELAMSINFNAAHLNHAKLVEKVHAQITECGLVPGSLNVEITEGILIGDPKRAREVLTRLRDMGVGVHLDDFGTGYSSLHYLHELPLDAIKIDRSFVAQMGGGAAASDAQVGVTIRELARRLGVPVIAEGVETPEQLAALRQLGCEYAQGYLFSGPLAHEEIAALIAQNPIW